MALDDVAKGVGDMMAATITVGVIQNAIPAIAGLFTIVWTGMRIYEMITGKKFSDTCFAKWMRREKK